MRVRVRLFAILRERAGRSDIELELPNGACVADALAQLEDLPPGLPLVMAVNRIYAGPEAPLKAGDELALIPPVSGGEERRRGTGEPVSGARAPGPPGLERPHVRVTAEPLLLDRLLDLVRDPAAGAVVVFQGVTRDVPRLEYEAYAEMAEAEIERIVLGAIERHGLCRAAVEHRVGTVALSEPSVAVVVSAPHRAEAFAGAREIIDEVKARAPIWKKEISDDGGGQWVTGTSPLGTSRPS
jgi:molybdopterin synthase catalytic subunit